MKVPGKRVFYVLSFTWGIIYTCAGLIVAAALMISGHKPKKHGYVYYFEVGKRPWGGMEWGMIFVKDKFSDEHIKNHEFGHAIQNCYFGPFMIFLVAIPSSCRYWIRRIYAKRGRRFKSGYEDIWFERQATELGTEAIKRFAESEG